MAQMGSLAPVRDLRMADFARFVAGYDAAHGTSALDAYRAKVGDIFDEALAADTLATAVIALMNGNGSDAPRRDEWKGTTSQLLAALESFKPKHDDEKWPTMLPHLSGELTRSAAEEAMNETVIVVGQLATADGLGSLVWLSPGSAVRAIRRSTVAATCRRHRATADRSRRRSPSTSTTTGSRSDSSSTSR